MMVAKKKFAWRLVHFGLSVLLDSASQPIYSSNTDSNSNNGSNNINNNNIIIRAEDRLNEDK